jgi:hypothetical protein
MNAKKTAGFFAGMMFLVIVFAAFLAQGQQGASVVATIGADCLSKPTNFTVPDGKTAYNFNVAKLEPGAACHGETTPPENKGFSIRDGKGRPIYTWSQYQTQTPYEKGGPLKNLTLIPGSYTLSIAGGAGAKVELSYQLK